VALSTLLLLLKSVWPFLEEVLLKDKTFKAFVSDNKTATFLSTILLIVFIIYLYTVGMLSEKTEEIQKMKDTGIYTSPSLEDANKRIKELEDQLKEKKPPIPEPTPTTADVPPPTTPTPTEHHTQPNPVASKGKKGKSLGDNLRDFTLSRLKSLDDNGN
jgi:type IV secretory pathway VirB10-like protein